MSFPHTVFEFVNTGFGCAQIALHHATLPCSRSFSIHATRRYDWEREHRAPPRSTCARARHVAVYSPLRGGGGTAQVAYGPRGETRGGDTQQQTEIAPRVSLRNGLISTAKDANPELRQQLMGDAWAGLGRRARGWKRKSREERSGRVNYR